MQDWAGTANPSMDEFCRCEEVVMGLKMLLMIGMHGWGKLEAWGVADIRNVLVKTRVGIFNDSYWYFLSPYDLSAHTCKTVYWKISVTVSVKNSSKCQIMLYELPQSKPSRYRCFNVIWASSFPIWIDLVHWSIVKSIINPCDMRQCRLTTQSPSKTFKRVASYGSVQAYQALPEAE